MWFLLILLASVIGISQSLPAPATSTHYELGVTYKYAYQFTILLNENSNITSRIASVGRNVGYRVSSEFLLSPVWQNSDNTKEQLVKLELLKPTLHVSSTMHSAEGINRHWSKLDNLSYPPIYIHLFEGQVKKVYILPDTKDMINIKKGIASLLQFKETDSKVKELDVSGLCEVRYKVHGSTIKKSKSNCQRSNFYLNNLKSKELLSPTVSTSSEIVININPQESIIQKVNGKEEVMMTLNLWKQAAVFVKTNMHVNFIEQYGGPAPLTGKLSSALHSIAEEMGSKLISESLEATSEGVVCAHCKPLNELVQEYGNNLMPELLGELKSAGGFLKVLDSFRRASKKELLMLFKDTDGRILTQLLDVLAAAQTNDALEVAFQLIDFESKDITIAERFLLCLATAPNPNEALIGKTLKLLNRNIKSEKLRATILITLSSLTRTYRKHDSNNAKSLIVDNISQLLLVRIQECKHVGCIINHLLAMRNLAMPQHLPILVEFVKKGGILGLMALEAMKEIGEEHFTQEVNGVLLRVYNQFWPHQESAARVLAAELLIKSNPTFETIGSIIMSLSDREQPEISTLVLKKLRNTMQVNGAVRSCVQDLLKNTTYGNYNNLAQNGSSTSVVNELENTHDANVTYGIDVEMRPTGMLKRTSFDLNLAGNNETSHLLSLSLFVEGFGLTDEEQKENPEEHSAGMQLSVLGVHLRPYIFFTGTAELMGLVWSGVGGQPTPALQANFLLMDQTHSVMLQNGVSVDFNLKGALSTDIAGSVEVSMWNKNSHAVVKNKGALLVHGHCRVDTSFVESHVDFALGGSSTLDMMVDLDFGQKPMAMCLQVEQPPYVFRHNVRKTETIPGSKHLIKTLKRRSMFFNGKSFNLFKKNSDSCKKLLFPKKQKSFW